MCWRESLEEPLSLPGPCLQLSDPVMQYRVVRPGSLKVQHLSLRRNYTYLQLPAVIRTSEGSGTCRALVPVGKVRSTPHGRSERHRGREDILITPWIGQKQQMTTWDLSLRS